MTETLGLIIFDMDGTLTKPCLDFALIRQEIGITRETNLIVAVEQLPASRRRIAMEIIERHEREAAEAAELYDGVHDILEYLKSRDIKTAIATRNSRQSALAIMHNHGFSVDYLDTRDDGPCKPLPDPVLRICRHFSILPESTWIIGDYLHDLESGRAAGARTVLMHGQDPIPEYANVADHVITDLREIIQLVEKS